MLIGIEMFSTTTGLNLNFVDIFPNEMETLFLVSPRILSVDPFAAVPMLTCLSGRRSLYTSTPNFVANSLEIIDLQVLPESISAIPARLPILTGQNLQYLEFFDSSSIAITCS